MSTQSTELLSVDPAMIEKSLIATWATLNQQSSCGAVTRAAMSNLIIYCDGEEQARHAVEHVAEIVEGHPARVLLLVAEAQADHELSARIAVHYRCISAATQLCGEYVELHFDPLAMERAASVVRSLLIGDLPTALWWFSTTPPALSGAVFGVLANMVHQIIYDSIGWLQPIRSVRAMARWVKDGETVVFNLVWRRLKPWRRILAQTLDPSVSPQALAGLELVELEHGPHALPMAWLLVGWLAARLGWQARSGRAHKDNWIEWEFRSSHAPVVVRIRRYESGPPQIESFKLTWREVNNNKGHARYRHEGNLLRLDSEGSSLPPAVMPVLNPHIEQMIVAQLAHRAVDTLFQQAVAVVDTMAKVLTEEV